MTLSSPPRLHPHLSSPALASAAITAVNLEPPKTHWTEPSAFPSPFPFPRSPPSPFAFPFPDSPPSPSASPPARPPPPSPTSAPVPTAAFRCFSFLRLGVSPTPGPNFFSFLRLGVFPLVSLLLPIVLIMRGIWPVLGIFILACEVSILCSAQGEGESSGGNERVCRRGRVGSRGCAKVARVVRGFGWWFRSGSKCERVRGGEGGLEGVVRMVRASGAPWPGKGAGEVGRARGAGRGGGRKGGGGVVEFSCTRLGFLKSQPHNFGLSYLTAHICCAWCKTY